MKKTLSIILPVIAMALMVSCKAKHEPVPSRDWDGTTYAFSSSDEPQSSTFYKPYTGFVGDPMPFFDPVSKQFVVGYLQEYRPNMAGTYHPIWGVRTSDVCNYEAMGEMIPCGGLYEQDAALGTGSMIYDDAQHLYYYFYTGHANEVVKGGCREAVQYATSSDMKTWKKNTSFMLCGTTDGYSGNDFRDPFVFKYNTEDGGDDLYHMIVTTRHEESGKHVLAEYVSSNLKDWKHEGIFMTTAFDGDRSYECPNVFKMGNWWYLVYSEQSTWCRRVQYFKAKSLSRLRNVTAGAVTWPDNHEGFLDCRGFYAGNTASDGTNRYIWGWCPTREGNDNTQTGDDKKEPMWAGSLVAHRLIQHEDGTLTLGDVPARASKYNESVGVRVMRETEQGWLYNRLDRHNHISLTVKAEQKDAEFAISLCHGTEMNSLKDSAAYYAIEFLNDGTNYHIDFAKMNDPKREDKRIYFIESYSMPIPDDQTYHIDLYTDNSVVVVYVNDQICWTNRICGQQKNCWGVEKLRGNISVSDVKVTKY